MAVLTRGRLWGGSLVCSRHSNDALGRVSPRQCGSDVNEEDLVLSGSNRCDALALLGTWGYEQAQPKINFSSDSASGVESNPNSIRLALRLRLLPLVTLDLAKYHLFVNLGALNPGPTFFLSSIVEATV